MDSKLVGSTVEMLILRVIEQGPTYGYEITQTVSARSAGYFDLKEGSLYPALHRLERQKLLKSSWREADGRRRKYYELTAAGKKELETRRRAWVEFTSGVEGILGIGRAGLEGTGA
jgi:transcriptional regulator